MDDHRILCGDVISHLKSLPDASVQCCMTSPPYWGLRDYGHAGQIGLEETPEAYVARMVEVFREVRRVLRDDGTCWVNLGDSYNNAGSSRNGTGLDGKMRGGATGADGECGYKKRDLRHALKGSGIKHKDLVGIPWRVAFALQADGWWLRQDIIWHKPNPMPESVRDRCTKAHEYVFLLTKSERYFYDAEAISESAVAAPQRRLTTTAEQPKGAAREAAGVQNPTCQGGTSATRNRRSVWRIPTKPYKGAHFATMPTTLAEPCILAGTSESGCCPHCGSPWERITQRKKLTRKRPNDYVKRTGEKGTGSSCANSVDGVSVETLGWQQTCRCEKHEPVPCVVLDPFGGSGTTSAVAKSLGRSSVYIELNPEYVELARKRIDEAGDVSKKKKPSEKQMEMFAN